MANLVRAAEQRRDRDGGDRCYRHLDFRDGREFPEHYADDIQVVLLMFKNGQR
jgi:hypothetical protein